MFDSSCSVAQQLVLLQQRLYIGLTWYLQLALHHSLAVQQVACRWIARHPYLHSQILTLTVNHSLFMTSTEAVIPLADTDHHMAKAQTYLGSLKASLQVQAENHCRGCQCWAALRKYCCCSCRPPPHSSKLARCAVWLVHRRRHQGLCTSLRAAAVHQCPRHLRLLDVL